MSRSDWSVAATFSCCYRRASRRQSLSGSAASSIGFFNLCVQQDWRLMGIASCTFRIRGRVYLLAWEISSKPPYTAAVQRNAQKKAAAGMSQVLQLHTLGLLAFGHTHADHSYHQAHDVAASRLLRLINSSAQPHWDLDGQMNCDLDGPIRREYGV